MSYRITGLRARAERLGTFSGGTSLTTFSDGVWLLASRFESTEDSTTLQSRQKGTSVESKMSWDFSFSITDSEASLWTREATSRLDTVVSRPLLRWTCAYERLNLINLASSTKGSFLFRTCFFTNTRPGLSYDGKVVPFTERWVFINILSLVIQSGCRTVSNNGSRSGLAPAQNILAVQVWFGFTWAPFRGSGLVQVHSSKLLLVQVRFRFIDLKFNCCYSFRPEKKKEKLLILLMITTALIERVPAPAASRYGKIYSYFC